MTDTERLDWLEYITEQGYCPTILFDDNGNWTVSFSGAAGGDRNGRGGIRYDFYWPSKPDWHPTIREAIDAAKARVEAE